MLLSCLHNAPVSFYAIVIQAGETIYIEQYDNYSKQTYRNRCRILGANGPIDLVVPVVKNRGRKTLMKDIRVDYDTRWNRIHWRSIYSAYASAPFFEFFEHDLRPVYKKKYTFLLDMNLDLMNITVKALQWNGTIKLSDSYSRSETESDYRESIHPKKRFRHSNLIFDPLPYHQVFEERHGFIPELSILDLLFNEGANARPILMQSSSKKTK